MSGKVFLTGVLTAIAYVAMEMGLHSAVLADIYSETAALWRPQGEMKTLFPFMIAGQAFFGFLFGVIYTKGFQENNGFMTQGFRYGLLMALMLGPASGLVWYTVLPIPQKLAIGWGLGGAIECLVLGMIAGLIYRDW
jgi:hypothetical protein